MNTTCSTSGNPRVALETNKAIDFLVSCERLFIILMNEMTVVILMGTKLVPYLSFLDVLMLSRHSITHILFSASKFRY